jgi:hypothetical protein
MGGDEDDEREAWARRIRNWLGMALEVASDARERKKVGTKRLFDERTCLMLFEERISEMYGVGSTRG